MKLPVLFLRFSFTLLVPALLIITACNKSSEDGTTGFVPVATTSAIISNLSSTEATFSGNITNFIAGSISSYGVCYSATNATPTTADSKTALTTSNTVYYTTKVTGLTPATKYYVRAYAVSSTNSTVYGSVIQITTLSATGSISGSVTTFAGSGVAGNVNGTGTAAQLNNPQGVVADAAGNIYVSDAFNNAIKKITAAGVVTTLAGSGAPGFTDGTGAAATFYSPAGLAIDGTGNVYVADQGNNAIRKVTPAGVVTTLAGTGAVGYADASTGATAKFNNPVGVAVDASGTVYVADRNNNVIRKITSAGVVSTLAGVTTAGLADATATTSQFRLPSSLALDGKGNLLVTDQGNNAIRKVTIADGSVNTVFVNKTADTDLMMLPAGITADNKGNFFITDPSGRIYELTSANVLNSIAGMVNTNGFVNGTGTSAQFNTPMGITADAAGNVYIADMNNNVIRKLTVVVKL